MRAFHATHQVEVYKTFATPSVVGPTRWHDSVVMADSTADEGGFPYWPDLGDEYRNPVILADYSDPDVIRDGDDFWLTASSFNCTPGLPILHSRDLVNWTIVNHAVRNLPDPRGVYDRPQHGCGVWAPAIRKHAGLFWIFFPMPDEGIYVTTAADPRGTWSEPWLLLGGRGLIDPCPLWDDDGRAYLVHAYANSRAGIKHRLDVREMSPDGRAILSEPRTVWNDPQNHPTCEGPKFHKFAGRYYISAPAGGVASGWQLILRSDHVYGPYEGKVVLAQGNTPVNGPHQGAIVDTPSGDWWFLHFQELQPYGRICHLQPVKWKDGWPLMGTNQNAAGCGEPVLRWRKPVANMPRVVPQTSDDFSGETLGLQWQWHANHRPGWHSLSRRPGTLSLRAIHADRDFANVPNLLLQKTPARSFTAAADVRLVGDDPHAQAGLIVMGIEHAALAIGRDESGPRLVFIVNNQVITGIPLKVPDATLRVQMRDGGACTFGVRRGDGSWQTINQTPFRATEGKWIGAKVGLFARTTEAGSAETWAEIGGFEFAPA